MFLCCLPPLLPMISYVFPVFFRSCEGTTSIEQISGLAPANASPAPAAPRDTAISCSINRWWFNTIYVRKWFCNIFTSKNGAITIHHPIIKVAQLPPTSNTAPRIWGWSILKGKHELSGLTLWLQMLCSLPDEIFCTTTHPGSLGMREFRNQGL